MKNVLKALGLLLVLLLAYVVYFVQTSSTDYSFSLASDAVSAPVEIIFDDMAVPHIYAETEDDAMYALGYVHASERLWQMDLLRRAGAGPGLLSVVPDQPVQFIGRPTNPARLREVGDALNADHGANLRLAGDEFCRVGDVAYERDGRDVPELMRLRDVARAAGVFFVWSSVHVHLAERLPDKGEGLLQMLQRWGRAPSAVATIGDAPNDAGLFTPGRFGLTVGTADVVGQAQDFPHLPQMVTSGRELDGFLELARGLLDSRGVQNDTH